MASGIPGTGDIPEPDRPNAGLHGGPRCPGAPAGCEACSGEHHWIEDGFDPTEPPDDDPDPVRVAVAAYDIEHGTEHGLFFYGCKHCGAWAEADYIMEPGRDRPAAMRSASGVWYCGDDGG